MNLSVYAVTKEDGMTNDLLDLADRLYTVAGMIMEDNNLLAISTPTDATARIDKLNALAVAGDDISTMIKAAQILVRMG